MGHAAVEDCVKIPKQEYNLLKEVYRTVKRQAFIVRIDEAERNFAAGKAKSRPLHNPPICHFDRREKSLTVQIL